MSLKRLHSVLTFALAVSAMSLPSRGFAASAGAPATPDLAAQIKRGHKVFNGICFACHQHNGLGMPSLFPPLAHSDFLRANPERAAWIVTHGLSGPVTVDGKTFNSAMPAQTQLNDQQVADVVTYVLNSWGNSWGQVTLAEVRHERARIACAK